MSDPIGWYVRVQTGEIRDGVYDTVLYVVGHPTRAEAEAAVRRVRPNSHELLKVLDEVVAGRGPQPDPGEVRLLKGAV
jgi:hypothetical protein